MNRLQGKIAPVQNLGIVDRMIRFFGGGVLLAGGVLGMLAGETGLVWAAVLIILSIYPLMTTMMGWDPFYHMAGARTCSLEGGRNQCGTFPYEVDAALGHEPRPEKGYEYDRSLSGAQHGQQPKTAAR